ncbi:MAG: hypothetical protein NE327_18770 [Lentisphaeraceae bacterium]|nr:hypothetical protein [Lentisphaeraceae bacterium]
MLKFLFLILFISHSTLSADLKEIMDSKLAELEKEFSENTSSKIYLSKKIQLYSFYIQALKKEAEKNLTEDIKAEYEKSVLILTDLKNQKYYNYELLKGVNLSVTLCINKPGEDLVRVHENYFYQDSKFISNYKLNKPPKIKLSYSLGKLYINSRKIQLMPDEFEYIEGFKHKVQRDLNFGALISPQRKAYLGVTYKSQKALLKYMSYNYAKLEKNKILDFASKKMKTSETEKSFTYKIVNGNLLINDTLFKPNGISLGGFTDGVQTLQVYPKYEIVELFTK